MSRACRLALVIACAAALPGSAGAQALDDADTELARTYFEAGTAHYLRQDYARAIVAFEEARRLKSLPALDYDIGRCHERLDHPRAALASYETYLANVAVADNLVEVRERIRDLRARLARERKRYLVPGVVAGVDLALAAVATGLVASVGPELHDLTARYEVAPTAALQDDAHALQRRATAGYALFGVAGALTLVDVALWVLAARQHRRATR